MSNEQKLLREIAGELNELCFNSDRTLKRFRALISGAAHLDSKMRDLLNYECDIHAKRTYHARKAMRKLPDVIQQTLPGLGEE